MTDQHTPLETEMLTLLAKLIGAIRSAPVLILNEPMVKALEDARAFQLKLDGQP